MDKSSRNAAIAAAIILIGFGVAAFYLPNLVVALGEISPYAGAAVAALFVLAFFGVFWLRGRSRGGRGDE